MNRAQQRQFENDPVLQAAADWFVELQSGDLSEQRIAEWERWLAAHERHHAAFADLEAMWNAVDEIPVAAWPHPQELSNDRYYGEVPVSEWCTKKPERSVSQLSIVQQQTTITAALSGSHTQSRHAAGSIVSGERHRLPALLTRTKQMRRYKPALAAAALVGLIGGASLLPQVRVLFAPEMLSVDTKPGERHSALLADGSRITVGGGSAVAVRFNPQRREIQLNRGEAYFDVAKDAKRPFIVTIAGTSITALGTAFNIRCADDHAVISVSEGVVQIDAVRNASRADAVNNAMQGTLTVGPKLARITRLAASQQISISLTGDVIAKQVVDSRDVGGWRRGRLQYINEPLSAVVNDVRRYGFRDIEFSDPAIGDLSITGTVFADDIDSWLETLESSFPLRVTQETLGKVRLELLDK